MQKIKIGIVGLGRMGKFHAEDIAYRMKNAELTAVCCRTKERAVTLQKEFGAGYAFDDYEEMLRCEELEAVVICSVSEKHCEQVIKAINAGKHVFCEKPLGMSVKQCQAVEKSVHGKKSLIIQIGFMTRYDRAYLQARQMIKEGKIGRPVYFRSYRMDAVRNIQSSIDFAERSGGLFFDVAVHDFDLARWLLEDEITSVYALGDCYRYNEFSQYSDCDNGVVTMEFESGAVGTILSGRTCSHGFHVETEIIGTHGTLHISPRSGQTELFFYDEKGVNQQFDGWFSDRFKEAFLNEKEDFVNCILNGTNSQVTIQDALAAVEASEAAWNSYQYKERLEIMQHSKQVN